MYLPWVIQHNMIQTFLQFLATVKKSEECDEKTQLDITQELHKKPSRYL